MATALMGYQPEQLQGVRMTRIGGENLPVKLRCFRQSPGLMMAQRVIEQALKGGGRIGNRQQAS
jgi:hypothetical protein